MANIKIEYQCDLGEVGTPDTQVVGYVRCNSLSTGLTITSVANDAATATPNTNIPIRVASTRKYGVIARHIVIQRITTTTTSSNIKLVRVPIFTSSVFIQYISQVGGSISYDGLEDWKLIGAEQERYRLFFGA